MDKKIPWILAVATVWFSFPVVSLAAPPLPGTVQMRGEIVPVVRLEVGAQGQVVERGSGRQLFLNFGDIDAQAIHRNPIGRGMKSRRSPGAYYQTDLLVRVQLSGNTSPGKLIISQAGPGPLQELVYETERNQDLEQVGNLRPIPLEPQRQISVSGLAPGRHELARQLVIRVPPSLRAGKKQAFLLYNLEVRP